MEIPKVETIFKDISDTMRGRMQEVDSLLRKGSERYFVIREEGGRVLFKIPLTLGVGVTLLFMLVKRLNWAVMLALIFMFSRLEMAVEPREALEAAPPEPPPKPERRITPVRSRPRPVHEPDGE
jgi:hypothetical protein